MHDYREHVPGTRQWRSQMAMFEEFDDSFDRKGHYAMAVVFLAWMALIALSVLANLAVGDWWGLLRWSVIILVVIPAINCGYGKLRRR